MQTYLDQVVALAGSAGVDLKRAVLHAGISDSQYYRWITRTSLMGERSARRVCAAIHDLAKASLKNGSRARVHAHD